MALALIQACLQVEGSLKIQNASKLQFHGCHNNVSNGGGAGLNGGEDDGVENNGGGKARNFKKSVIGENSENIPLVSLLLIEVDNRKIMEHPV